MQYGQSWFVVAVLLHAVIVAAANAGDAGFPRQEIARWDAHCTHNINCLAAWGELKRLEAALSPGEPCGRENGECMDGVLFRAYGALKDFSTCDKPESCVHYLNRSAERYEERLIGGVWCAFNLPACGYVKTQRAIRLQRKKNWCEEHLDVCRQALHLRIYAREFQKQVAPRHQ